MVGNGVVVQANTAADRMFRVVDGGLVGLPLEQLMPERFRAAHTQHRNEFHAAPRSRDMAEGRRLWAQRGDGTEFLALIALQPVPTDDGALTLVAMQLPR